MNIYRMIPLLLASTVLVSLSCSSGEQPGAGKQAGSGPQPPATPNSAPPSTVKVAPSATPSAVPIDTELPELRQLVDNVIKIQSGSQTVEVKTQLQQIQQKISQKTCSINQNSNFVSICLNKEKKQSADKPQELQEAFDGTLNELKKCATGAPVNLNVNVVSVCVAKDNEERIKFLEELLKRVSCLPGAGTFPQGMKFVTIPPGTFRMGLPDSDPERSESEPPHQVTLTQPFEMQTTEVTQGQWQSVMGNNPSSFGWLDNPNLPVEQVSWNQVQEFIKKLNGLCQGSYRLPTEAEWEYAIRGGTATAFFFGNEPEQLGQYAWYFDNSYLDDAGKQSIGGVKDRRPHPVGLKSPNALGLYDMAGNVSEWTADLGGDYRSETVTDPVGATTGHLRVFRGGSFKSEAKICKSGHRGYTDPADSRDDRGFRLIRAAPAKP